MRHANDIAVTLTQFPQYYEPLFLERDHKGRTVSIVDEWCCGYVKGIALDPSGWKPFIEEHPTGSRSSISTAPKAGGTG